MNIKLNGKDIEFNGNTLLELLKEYNLEPVNVVVEKNMDIIHREKLKDETVANGDVIEVITFVGGG